MGFGIFQHEQTFQRATCSALFISHDIYSIQYPAPGLAVSCFSHVSHLSKNPVDLFLIILFLFLALFLALYCSVMACLWDILVAMGMLFISPKPRFHLYNSLTTRGCYSIREKTSTHFLFTSSLDYLQDAASTEQMEVQHSSS